MSDLAKRVRDFCLTVGGLSVHNNLLRECADALEAKDAEIKQLREQRDNEAWMHAACLTIAETGERWGDEIYPSLAMRKVLQLRERANDLLAEVHRQDAEIARLTADLLALRAAVMGLPEYRHQGFCPGSQGYPGAITSCSCGADAANAARAAARLIAGEVD